MDNQAFTRAYDEFRSGVHEVYQHPLGRALLYSDGVKECAETGCSWLLDIIATECLKPLRDSLTGLGTVEVMVFNRSASLRLVVEDGGPAIWTREIEHTDMPEGLWVFFLNPEGAVTTGDFVLCLPSEW